VRHGHSRQVNRSLGDTLRNQRKYHLSQVGNGLKARRNRANLTGINYSEIHFGLLLPDAKIGLELVDELESFICSTEHFLEWTNYEFSKFLKVDFS
jgi:hypothetical protein